MRYNAEDLEHKAVLDTAALMCAAARTAPKTKGLDNIVTLVLTGEDKDLLCDTMVAIGHEVYGDADTHYVRDAANVRKAQAVVLIGVKRHRYGLPNCGMCGFINCDACAAANANCAFAPIDLGIALGSAVSVATDLRIDNRIMFSIGKAAEKLQLLEGSIIWQGIPLSVSGKNVFFDRKPGAWKK